MSVTLLSGVLSVMGTLWTFLKGSEWFKSRVSEKQEAAIELIESIVMKVYNAFVREKKKNSSDGKLSLEDGKEALNLAVNECLSAAKERGLSDLSIFKNKDLLVNQIEWTIRNFKSA